MGAGGWGFVVEGVGGCGCDLDLRAWLLALLRVGGEDGVGVGDGGGGVVAGLVFFVLEGGGVGEDEGLGGAGALGGGSADGDAAEEVVADVVRVGVDEVLGGAGEAGEGGDERGGVGGGVDGEEGAGEGGGVVDGPGEREGAVLGGIERGDDGGFDGGGAEGVGGGEDVEGDVAAGAHVDEFGVMGDGGPGAVGALVLGGVAVLAEVLDEDVLDVGAGVGEAPGDVGVAAYDDEGDAGEGEACDVE